MKKILFMMMMIGTKAFALTSYVPVVVDLSSKPVCTIPTTIPFGTHLITPAFLNGISDNTIFQTAINVSCDTFTPMQINLVSPGIDLKLNNSTATEVFDLYVGGGYINGWQLVDTNLLTIGNAFRNADGKVGVLGTAGLNFLLKAKDINAFKTMFNQNSGSFQLNTFSKTVNFTF